MVLNKKSKYNNKEMEFIESLPDILPSSIKDNSIIWPHQIKSQMTVKKPKKFRLKKVIKI